MRVAILGRTGILYRCIELLQQEGHEIVLIGTCAAAPEYDIRENDFKEKAEELNVPYFNDVRINCHEITDLMKGVHADVAVSVNWITIIKREATSCFKYGILNAHCGDLPRYRGNACPNWSIIKGDEEYAISIHYMEPGELDSGDILLKEYYPITEETTITDIYENMDVKIPKLFVKAVNMLEEGKTKGIAQSKNVEDSLRCYPRIPTDSFIDWNESSDIILKNIRASSKPFQGAFFFFADKKIYVFEAKRKNFPSPCYVYPGQVVARDNASGEVEVASSDGIIVLKELWLDGKKYRAADILKSMRIRLNYCIPDEIYQLKQEILSLKEEIKKMREQI